MSKTWETPRVLVEEFEENEYLAACYSVVCDVNGTTNILPLICTAKPTNFLLLYLTLTRQSASCIYFI